MAVARQSIASGRPFFDELLRVPHADRDRWVDEVLGIGSPPPDGPLPAGAVPYLPCGVAEIVASVVEAPIDADDVVVDVGSGLGRVAIVAHLLTGARACGIEIQAPLVDSARQRCRALGLTDVSFVHANAADIELDGSVFFLYAPCNGDLLRRVLLRLEAVARRRSIVVCGVHVSFDAPWLRPRETSSVALTLYDSAL